MNRRNFSNIGNDIIDIVQNAVNTRDYHQLNRDIENTVNNALDELKSSIGFKQKRFDQNQYNQNQYNQNQYNQNQYNQNQYNQNRYNQSQYNQGSSQTAYKKEQYNANGNKPDTQKTAVTIGRVSGTLCTVFGSIGIGLFGIAIIVMGILGEVLYRELFFTILIGLVPLFVASIVLTVKGSITRRRLKRFHQYIAFLKDKNYCMIKDLASYCGRENHYIIKDLRKMIAIGMFPEGHLDEQKTYFMLDNECYDQYLKLQEKIKAQQSEKRAEQNKKETREEESQNPELKKAIEEGKAYVRQIREANDEIPGEEVSQKLYHLEDVTSKIFDYVALHPEQLSDIQKFMEYYLPTTSKLLMAYREFDMQPVQGENISTAKREIESTLDTINLAFEKLLDSLFQDVAMDVSTDISVLNTMLKQEGLTENDFE